MAKEHFVVSNNAHQVPRNDSAHSNVGHGRNESPSARLLFAGLAILIVLAPLPPSYSPAATLMLLWLALALLIGTVWRPGAAQWRTSEIAFLCLLFATPLFFLIPLPQDLAQWLPARDIYVQARALAHTEPLGPQPLSLHPLATESSWLVLVLPIGTYVAMRALPEQMQLRVVYIFFAIVLAQVLIALFQFATGSGVQYAIVDLLARSGASGTYINRNHLAGMIEMALPLALALSLFHFGRQFRTTRRTPSLRERAIAVLKAGNRPSWIFVLLSVLFTVGVVATRSRTGIAMMMLGILLTTILFSRRVGGRGSFGLTGQLITISIGVAIFIGLAPVLDRFSVAELGNDARVPIAVATFDAAGALLPFGSGPGTFPDVFVLYQPIELGRWFINYAHNDYLQIWFEVGLLGLALIAAFLVLYAVQWPRLVTPEEWSRYRALQIGAGIAMLLLLVHSVTDNNLRNPANMTYFAILAALFFSPPGAPKLSDRPRKRKRRTVTLAESGVPQSKPDTAAEDSAAAATPRRSRNPFSD